MQFSKSAAALFVVVAAQLVAAAPIPDGPNFQLLGTQVKSSAASNEGGSAFSQSNQYSEHFGGEQRATGGVGGGAKVVGSSNSWTTGDAFASANNKGSVQNSEIRAGVEGKSVSLTDGQGRTQAHTTSSTFGQGADTTIGQNSSANAKNNQGTSDANSGAAGTTRDGHLNSSSANNVVTTGAADASAASENMSDSATWIEKAATMDRSNVNSSGNGSATTKVENSGYADPWLKQSATTATTGKARANAEAIGGITTGDWQSDRFANKALDNVWAKPANYNYK